MEFIELKNELLEKAKAANACKSEYQKAYKADTEADLLKVISNNLTWCVENKCVSHEYFKGFSPETYSASGIANTGEDNVGYRNTGDRNTGDRNTGNRNTGDRNTGDRNTGDRNTGDRNTGNWNTGDSNTGDSNTGYWNTGDSNTGDSNTGNWNTGDRNTGDRNTGNWNTGDSNTGDSNTGYWNTGDRNTGYSNMGNYNSGAFCTGEPTIKIFNKDSNMTHEQFTNSRVFSLLCQVDTKLWVPDHAMTDAEKEANKGWKLNEGFYRDISFKQAFTDKWNNWSEENRNEFKSLPNFDNDIFEQITGVNVES